MPVTDQSPNVIIIDSTENLMEVSGGVAVSNGTKGLLFAGVQSNGSASYLLTDTSGRLTITGSLTVPNVVTVTGSLALSQTATVTGSITVPNTVTVTGSVGITNFPVSQSVTGVVGISGIPTITGSVTVPNTVTVTGSISVTNVPTITGSITVANTPTVTGSVSVLNTVNVAFSDPAEGTTSSAPPSKAIFIAGFDAGSTVIRGLSVDAAGKLNVNATAAGSPNVGGTGSIAPTSASLGGGVDAGGILRPLFTDNTGKQIVQVFNTASITGSVGISGIATVTGSITVANTVTITGSVGITNFPVTQSVTGSVGISGIPTITGSITVANVPTITGSIAIVDAVYDAIAGTAVPGRGVFVGGKDTSGNFQGLAVTTGGFLFVSGNVSASIVGTPTITGTVGISGIPTVTGSITVPNTVTVTGSVGITATTFDAPNNGTAPARVAVIGGLSGSTIETIAVNNSGSIFVNSEEEKTFIITANSVTIGNNKSMLALFNSGSNNGTIKIREIWIKNVQTTAVTGIASIFELFRFTGQSAVGTSVTPQTYDTIDAVPNNLTGSTGGTITGESASSMVRWVWSSDDWGPGTLDQEGLDHAGQNLSPLWSRRDPKEKAIVVRANQGIHIKHTVNSAAGSFDLTIVFTQV